MRKLPRKIKVKGHTYELETPKEITYKGARYVRADFADREDRRDYVKALEEFNAGFTDAVWEIREAMRGWKDKAQLGTLASFRRAVRLWDNISGEKDESKRIAKYADAWENLQSEWFDFADSMRDKRLGKEKPEFEKAMTLLRSKFEPMKWAYDALID